MDLDLLSSLLAECPYPENMVAIDRGITGNGYYPGARGFSLGSDPTHGVMLLGRDFGLFSYYMRRSAIPNADETMYTWRRTVECALKPLIGCGVWAVNYLLGARSSGLATGDLRDLVSAEEWNKYEEYCWHFLCCLVLLQRPKCIVVYGQFNARDLQRSERLSGPTHSFGNGSGRHTASIMYAPHPSSVRSRVAEQHAHAWYRELAASLQ